MSVCSLHVGEGGIAAVSPGQAPSPWPAPVGGGGAAEVASAAPALCWLPAVVFDRHPSPPRPRPSPGPWHSTPGSLLQTPSGGLSLRPV